MSGFPKRSDGMGVVDLEHAVPDVSRNDRHADKSIKRFDVISISAGVRGLQILLTPVDYFRAAKAMLSAIAVQKGLSRRGGRHEARQF